jgi:hypothetical protein
MRKDTDIAQVIGDPPRGTRGIQRAAIAPAVIALLAVVLGCAPSDKVTVSGRVTRVDGSPVVGARVVFRSPETGKSARAITGEEGTYSLGTVERGDGVHPGGYYVVIVEDRGSIENPRPRTFHAKYERPNTSGFVIRIKEGESTNFDMELDLP